MSWTMCSTQQVLMRASKVKQALMRASKAGAGVSSS
jgi:hypothetical protein